MCVVACPSELVVLFGFLMKSSMLVWRAILGVCIGCGSGGGCGGATYCGSACSSPTRCDTRDLQSMSRRFLGLL